MPHRRPRMQMKTSSFCPGMQAILRGLICRFRLTKVVQALCRPRSVFFHPLPPGTVFRFCLCRFLRFDVCVPDLCYLKLRMRHIWNSHLELGFFFAIRRWRMHKNHRLV